jgi:SAM-dependent methyltransferase
MSVHSAGRAETGGADTVNGASPRRSRESFDEAAADYDRYRSGYPDRVIDHVLATGGLRHGSRVLEIGCGTGQLSVPLARHGIELIAVELGPHLAELARRNLAEFPNASVEVAAFETWPLGDRTFEAVVAASALHWLDPEVRYTKSVQALHPGGSLIIIHAHHVVGGTPGFFADTQPAYLRWGLNDDPFFRPPDPLDVPTMFPELEARPEFCWVKRHRFEIPRHHTTESYVGWLRTDSLILSLDREARDGFLHDIARLIDTKYYGHVARNFVYEVVTARRAG